MFAHIIPGGLPATSTFYHTITSNVNGINLWSVVVAANGGSTPSQGNIEVTINAGVEIGAVDNTSGTNYAIDVPSDFASNSKTLTIINNGYVGGFGGNGGEYDVSVPGNGGNGGTAINFNSNATLINNGTLAGGGGGGGGNTGVTTEPFIEYYSDGGGGAGLPAGTAGGGYSASQGYTAYGANNGTRDAGGLAQLGVDPDDGPGGNGGNPGQAGQNGGTTGGAAGYPYQENTGITVTFTNSGTVYGSPLLS